MTEQNECKVMIDAKAVLSASGDLTKAMQKLRHSKKLCKKCLKLHNCEVWKDFTSQIDQAIIEVNEEWGLYV
jgi:hypothetical protein